MKNVLLSWSSGKDSAWALHLLRQDPGVQVVGLLTTLNGGNDRVSMHGVQAELLKRQAEAAGIIQWTVKLPQPCSDGLYATIMRNTIEVARMQGITAVAFGDLFLKDIREYREKQMAESGLEALFPLWTQSTYSLAMEMQAAGLKARVVCVDPKLLDRSFCGREWDGRFLEDLPEGVDPCGENGEFHTFAYEGPVFRRPIPFEAGETVEREGFLYADLTMK